MNVSRPHARAKIMVYSPPSLSVYGDVLKLTAAGSTGVSEGKSGQTDKKP